MILKFAVGSWQLAKKKRPGRFTFQISLPTPIGITIFHLLFSIFFFPSCKNHKPDISNIKVDLKVERFEQDLFSLDTLNRETSIQQLRNKYGDFFSFYFNDYSRQWRIQSDSSRAWQDSVFYYIKDRTLQALNDSVQKKFSNLSGINNDLTTAFRYYKYYFPRASVPSVVTLINGPSHGAFTYGDTLLCIALDDYMDPQFSYYKFEDVPQYLIRRFKPEYIVPNCMQVTISHQFPFDPSGKKLLDAMIYNGKILYLRGKLMPDRDDSVTTGFAERDLKWCNENEKEIWKFFITKNLLYSQDPLEYLKYVNEGPTTSGMPPESPGNVGSWVGWKIVSAYMHKHPEVSLQQLMSKSNAQDILAGSKYKP